MNFGEEGGLVLHERLQGTAWLKTRLVCVDQQTFFSGRLLLFKAKGDKHVQFKSSSMIYIKWTINRDRGGGGAGRAAAPPLFCAPAPTFCAKGKIIKFQKKGLETSFFPSIFRYILCIFFNFKRQAFCGAPVLFAVIVPLGRLAPWLNSAMPWPPLRFVRQRVLYFQLRQSFLPVLSDEMKKITSFFKPNEGE